MSREPNAIPFIIVTVAFLIIGSAALLGPRTIQRWALRYYAAHPWQANLNLFLRWMRTDSYVRTLRLLGVITLVVGMWLLVLFLKKVIR